MSADDIGGPSGPFILAVGWAGLATAPILTAGIWLDGSVPAPPLPLIFLFVLIGVTLVIALGAALIGLPLTWLLARSGREAPWTYPAAGLIAGGALLVGLDRIGSTGEWRPADEWLPIAAFGGGPGFVCGVLWWFLYRRHFPQGGRRMTRDSALPPAAPALISPARRDASLNDPSNAWSDNG